MLQKTDDLVYTTPKCMFANVLFFNQIACFQCTYAIGILVKVFGWSALKTGQAEIKARRQSLFTLKLVSTFSGLCFFLYILIYAGPTS